MAIVVGWISYQLGNNSNAGALTELQRQVTDLTVQRDYWMREAAEASRNSPDLPGVQSLFSEQDVRRFYGQCIFRSWAQVIAKSGPDTSKVVERANEIVSEVVPRASVRYVGEGKWLIQGEMVFEEGSFRFVQLTGYPSPVGTSA